MGIYEASIEESFTARHAVRLPDGGIEAPHEHRWKVTATFRSGSLDPTMSVVVDFLIVQEVMEEIASELENRNLNELEAFCSGGGEGEGGEGASAERVAEFLAEQLMHRLKDGSKLYRLAVTEAAGCSAAYYPGRA